MALAREKFRRSAKQPLGRRLGASLCTFAMVSLVHSMFLTLDKRVYADPGTEAASFTWLHLPPLVLVEETAGQPEEIDQATQLTLEDAPDINIEDLSIEDLEVVALPFLRNAPSNALVGGATNLDLRQYFSCSLANYEALSEGEKSQCTLRLAALKSERDLLNPRALPFVLTAREAQQWRNWERNLLERQAPLLLPCLNGSGFLTISVASIKCFVETVDDGFDPSNNPLNRYAELP